MKRNETIDLIKGLGILLVVLGHSGFPYKGYIYLFHMPIFFMASGYCFNTKHALNPTALGRYVGKKVTGLYVPYVLFNAVFWLLHNKLIDWNILTDNPAFPSPKSRLSLADIWARLNHGLHFNPGGTHQLCGADWFVLVLFYITILFAVVYWMSGIIKSPRLRHCIPVLTGIAALFIGHLLQKKDLLLDGYWTPAITGYSLYVLGFYLRSLPVKFQQFLEKAKYAIILAGFPLLWLAGQYGSISLNVNHFENPVFLVSCSLLGWFWLQAWAQVIAKADLLKRFSICLSKSSLFILFLHFLAFKLITAVQVAVYQEKAYMLASFPILHSEGFWWIAYTVVGVLLPVGVKLLFDQLLALVNPALPPERTSATQTQ